MFKMKGVIPPMITPFDEGGEVDYEALITLVEFLKENVDGLFVPALMAQVPYDYRRAEKGCRSHNRYRKRKIPVIVMVGTTNNRESQSLSNMPVLLALRR